MRAPRPIRPDPTRGPVSPKWRNWQTRQVQDLVPLTGVEVRVLSSAFLSGQGLRSTNLPLAFFVEYHSSAILLLLLRWRGPHVGVLHGVSATQGRFVLLPVLLPG